MVEGIGSAALAGDDVLGGLAPGKGHCVIDLGKPQQNAFIETFNGSLRDDLLNEEIFDTLAEDSEPGDAGVPGELTAFDCAAGSAQGIKAAMFLSRCPPANLVNKSTI